MKSARTALVIALSAAGLVFAADKAGSLSTDDQKFVETAARAGTAEVEAAKLAQQKGQSQAVKDFARQMETDHAKANDELKALAGQKGANAPAGPDAKHKRMMDELQKHSAAQFDREYMKGQVADHRQVVHEFEREAKNGKDADLKKWTNDKLPTLRHHLQMAESIDKDLAKMKK
jgi:putative membrane protein